MMYRWLICTAVFSLLTPTFLQAGPITVPLDLNLGDQYRLAFVTSGTRDATSSVIGDYNAFVQAAADAQPELASLGATWKAIASTATVDARDNTGTNPTVATGVPIYLLDGLKLNGLNTVLHNADLWDNRLGRSLNVAPSGSVAGAVLAWTGTKSDGTKSRFFMGGGGSFGVDVIAGIVNAGRQSTWIGRPVLRSNRSFSLYGLSSVLTVAPEVVVPEAVSSIVDVTFDSPVINSGPLSFGLSAFPANPAARIALGEGTPAGGGATGYGLGDVLSANLIFGDGVFTTLSAFDMQVLANGSIGALSYTFSPLDTPSVTGGVIVMNSPLFITGTDTASGQAFSYTYANSVETITAVPEPSSLTLLGIGAVGLFGYGWRRKRKQAA